MKRVIAVILSVMTVLGLFAGCKGKVDKGRELFNVDLSKYVTLGKYTELEIDKSGDTFKNYYNSFYEGDINSKDAYLKVTEGKVANGDVVNITYIGKKADGKIFTGDTTATDNDGKESYDLGVGTGAFIQGFEDQLIDMEVGSTKTFKITFPSDYGVEELDGQEVSFTVTANYIRKIPELNDEIAVKLGYKDAADYKEQTETDCAKQIIIDQILSSEDFAVKEYPEKDKETYDAVFTEYYNYAKEQVDAYNTANKTQIDVETGFYQIFGGTTESFKQNLINKLNQNIIIYAIFDAEKLSYTDEQKTALIDRLAKLNGFTTEELTTNYPLWEIESYIVSEIVSDFILSKAIIK